MTRAPRSVLEGKRDIAIGRLHPELLNNSIRTSKYTLYTFFLLNLFEQFKKPANDYFLVLSILQVIKPISISEGQPTILLPLVFVIIVAMIKDFFEDWKRTVSDREENNSPVNVFKNGQFVQDMSKNLMTGEIVKVNRDQFIPADLLLICSSNKKHDCYIETKNLDGETNLKVKGVPEQIRLAVPTEQDAAKVVGWNFSYEAPNALLYDFSGSVAPAPQAQIPIDNNNVLLRGCKLKNTESVVGVVIFTGHYTKIMMNSIKAKQKHSDLENKLNKYILLVFGMLLVFCSIASIMYIVWYNENKDNIPYVRLGSLNLAAEFFIRLGNWILIFG